MRIAIVCVFILGLLSSAFVAVQSYIKNSIAQGLRVERCETTMLKQNEEIAKNEVEKEKINSYNKNAKEQEEKTLIKYKVIKQKDTSCEARLKEIEHAITTFYHNPP